MKTDNRDGARDLGSTRWSRFQNRWLGSQQNRQYIDKLRRIFSDEVSSSANSASRFSRRPVNKKKLDNNRNNDESKQE
jgi:hypothetical protein